MLDAKTYFAAHAPVTLDDARHVWKGNAANREKIMTFDDLLEIVAELRWSYADKMMERTK